MALAPAILPRFVALRSPTTKKFLGFRKDPPNRGFLSFEYNDIWSPYVKLELVTDRPSGFISIRCCYNNKFWGRPIATNLWVVPCEASPNTDLSSQWCTLFSYDHDITYNMLSLRMAHCNMFVADLHIVGDLDGCLSLYAGEDPDFINSIEKFEVHGMSDIVRLPKNVVFRGDNGKYLGLEYKRARYHLVFNESEGDDQRVMHRVQSEADGNIILTCVSLSLPWTVTPYNKGLTVERYNQWGSAVFKPVRVDNHTVVLRWLGENLFCKRMYVKGGDYQDFFMALADSIDSEARLEVGEPVISRRVYSIEFDLDGAYVYGLEPLELATIRATNDTGVSHLTVPISYTERSTQSWNNSFSFTAGVEAEFEGRIPVMSESNFELLPHCSVKHKWGPLLEQERTVECNYTARVEPGQTLVLKAVATKREYEVKFSYIQKDILNNGEVVQTQMDDGVFRGMNYFNFVVIIED